MRALLASAAIVVGTMPVRAADVSWGGLGGSDWFTGSNWSTGSVPGAGDNAIVDGSQEAEISGADAEVESFSVGTTAQGHLILRESLSSTTAVLGGSADVTGTLDVTGSNAHWTNSGTATIGVTGAGLLNVTGGGQASAENAVLGNQAGSSGDAVVSGDGSSWTIGDGLTVGNVGRGSLQIRDGGTVSSTTAQIGVTGNQPSSVTVFGSGSRWDNSGSLVVGVAGQGSLLVEEAGTVTSADAVIGQHAGAQGSVTVTGQDSTWTNSGTMRIGGDSRVAVDPGGTGALTVQSGGRVETGSAIVGDVAGASGTVTVTGGALSADSVTASTWAIGGDLAVGRAGDGSLAIANGGLVTNAIGRIGVESTGVGLVTVIGSDSLWQNSGDLFVGVAGQGTLAITGGGAVENADGYVGAGTSAAVSGATVSGEGSTWTNSGNLSVGAGGQGRLEVLAGGSVSATQSVLGSVAGSTGTAVVDGDGSEWVSSGELIVGGLGTGDLTVSNGGAVSATAMVIGNEAAAQGTALVSGEGSTLTTPGTLVVGAAGSGTLTLTGGGSISAAQVVIAGDAGSTGVLNVGAASGATAADPGTLDAAAITFGSGTGSIVLNHSGTNYVLASKIGGAGSIDVQGGTTTLTGDNSYSGGTKVGAATLGLGSATAAGTGAITLGDGATLAYADGITVANPLVLNGAATLSVASGTATESGAISGAGSYSLGGDGTLNLTGDSSGFTGTTTVTGTLSANGTLGGAVIVQNGGTLKGSGSVGSASIQAGGTVAPGNSIGTLSVTGPYTQAAGSTYQAEVSTDGASSDRIAVTGTATLDPGAILDVTRTGAGAYPFTAHYTLLTATGGLTGTYTLTGDTAISPFYTLAASYDANSVYLDAVQTNSFMSAARTRNQRAVAGALDTLPIGNTVHDAVATVATLDQAQAAFEQLSGEVHASARSALLDDSRFVRVAGLDRVRFALSSAGSSRTTIARKAPGQASTPVSETRLSVWGSAFGSWGDLDGDGNAAGLSRSTGGFVAGADVPVGDNARVGIYGGYSRTDFDSDGRGSSGSSDNHHLGAYGGMQFGGVGVRAGAAYTWHAIDMSRSVTISGFSDRLSSDYVGGTAQVFGEVGYRLDLGPFAVEPFAGVSYVNLHTDSFAEKGGAAALNGSRTEMSTTFLTLGPRASADFQVGGVTGTARGMVGWRHAFGDDLPVSDMTLAGAPMSVAGTPIATDAAVLEAGLDVAVTRQISLGVSYAGQYGDGAVDHGVQGRLSWTFCGKVCP